MPITNYRKAWLDYRRTDDFKNSDEALKAKGIKAFYRRNILMSAFAAGWNATGKKIKFI
jgi:hypothetical protein